jgi:hypothetical protein
VPFHDSLRARSWEIRAVRVKCFIEAILGVERGWVLRRKASGSAEAECRWKVVVLRARSCASR